MMNRVCGVRWVIILPLLFLLAISNSVPGQGTTGEKPAQIEGTAAKAEPESLQKKAAEAEALIRGREADRDQLKRAVKLNQVDSAKEVLLRNGFTGKDLENAKIILLTGGGKGGEDGITISASCCEPKAITIQRTLENFTK